MYTRYNFHLKQLRSDVYFFQPKIKFSNYLYTYMKWCNLKWTVYLGMYLLSLSFLTISNQYFQTHQSQTTQTLSDKAQCHPNLDIVWLHATTNCFLYHFCCLCEIWDMPNLHGRECDSHSCWKYALLSHSMLRPCTYVITVPISSILPLLLITTWSWQLYTQQKW